MHTPPATHPPKTCTPSHPPKACTPVRQGAPPPLLRPPPPPPRHHHPPCRPCPRRPPQQHLRALEAVGARGHCCRACCSAHGLQHSRDALTRTSPHTPSARPAHPLPPLSPRTHLTHPPLAPTAPPPTHAHLTSSAPPLPKLVLGVEGGPTTLPPRCQLGGHGQRGLLRVVLLSSHPHSLAEHNLPQMGWGGGGVMGGWVHPAGLLRMWGCVGGHVVVGGGGCVGGQRGLARSSSDAW